MQNKILILEKVEKVHKDEKVKHALDLLKLIPINMLNL
ncbi:hypothetical protein C671_3376 [[Clostridium] bifermentans ATCC 19299]|nr:hypothetical protein C671_3376 [[Clostridium] bifermentans ATCC 19299] [Paraclostridium bifermentans ATCC 19299]